MFWSWVYGSTQLSWSCNDVRKCLCKAQENWISITLLHFVVFMWPLRYGIVFTTYKLHCRLAFVFSSELSTLNQQFLSAFEGCWQASSAYYRSYWTKTYRIALMCWSPLFPPCWASLPHVLEPSLHLPVPNPILGSKEPQTFWLLATIPNSCFRAVDIGA